MNFAIHGSYIPYIYLGLWQISIAAMQHIGLQTDNPRMAHIGFYTQAMKLIGGAVSWASWALGLWVGLRYGLAAGVAFASLGFGANALSIAYLYRHPNFVLLVHPLGLVAMPIMAYLTLASVGFP